VPRLFFAQSQQHRSRDFTAVTNYESASCETPRARVCRFPALIDTRILDTSCADPAHGMCSRLFDAFP